MARIYVASSWRCTHQQHVVALLRGDGHEVYDFRKPASGQHGFSWSEIDPNWRLWEPNDFRTALSAAPAERGFSLDMNALRWCDTCILVLPCNRSAHLELGWACGAGKRTAVYIPEPQEPELMYKMLNAILLSERELLDWAMKKEGLND